MGCGKSTWCEAALPTLNDAAVVSTDVLFEEAAAIDGITYNEAFVKYRYSDMVKSARARLIRAVLKERDIVIDQTNCTVRDRRVFRSSIPDTYEVIGVEFEFERGEIISRVLERAKRTGKMIPIGAVVNKMKSFEPCQEGEFDRVIKVPRGV
jgi:hypothetical protein